MTRAAPAMRLGRRVGRIEGTLVDLDVRTVARGSGIAIPTPFPDAAAV